MTSRHIINIVQIVIWIALGAMAGWAVSTGHKQHWLTLILSVIFIVSLAIDKTDGESLINTFINRNKNYDGRGN